MGFCGIVAKLCCVLHMHYQYDRSCPIPAYTWAVQLWSTLKSGVIEMKPIGLLLSLVVLASGSVWAQNKALSREAIEAIWQFEDGSGTSVTDSSPSQKFEIFDIVSNIVSIRIAKWIRMTENHQHSLTFLLGLEDSGCIRCRLNISIKARYLLLTKFSPTTNPRTEN